MQPQRRVVFLSFNDLDRMLARKCTKGSNLKDIWRSRPSWLLSLKSRRCGIFLYQLLERLFYVSCVRVGKKLHLPVLLPPSSLFQKLTFFVQCVKKGDFWALPNSAKNELLLRHNFLQVTSVRLFLGWKLSMSDFVGKLWNWISIMDATNPRRPLAASSQFRFMDEDRLV